MAIREETGYLPLKQYSEWTFEAHNPDSIRDIVKFQDCFNDQHWDNPSYSIAGGQRSVILESTTLLQVQVVASFKCASAHPTICAALVHCRSDGKYGRMHSHSLRATKVYIRSHSAKGVMVPIWYTSMNPKK